MRNFFADTVLQEDGKLNLDHLPFQEGDAVRVFITATERPVENHHLRGTVLKYEQPFDPVAPEDWIAVQ